MYYITLLHIRSIFSCALDPYQIQLSMTSEILVPSHTSCERGSCSTVYGYLSC